MNIYSISCEIVLRWMPQDLTDDKPTLVQEWLGAVRQHSVAWIIVDPDLSHMVWLGHNELTDLRVIPIKSYSMLHRLSHFMLVWLTQSRSILEYFEFHMEIFTDQLMINSKLMSSITIETISNAHCLYGQISLPPKSGTNCLSTIKILFKLT